MNHLPRSATGRYVAAIGGGLVFAASLAYFGFMYATRYGVVADRSANSLGAVAADVVLFSAFALHHSVLARSGVKTRIARTVPPDMERTVYVWIASLLFIAVCAAWRLVPGTVWAVDGAGAWGLHVLQASAAAIAVWAGRVVGVLDLAGLRDALGRPPREATALIGRGPYRLIRHPLYLAWLLVVWPSPVMTGTRFVFALVSTIYLLLAIPFEERDLRRTFGNAYTTYAGRVKSRLVPGLY